MVKKGIFFCIGYIPSSSSIHPHLESYHLDKEYYSETPNLHLYQLTKNIAADIVPHISSVLRDLSVIFEQSILSSSPKLEEADHVYTLD